MTDLGMTPVDDPAGTLLALDFDGTLAHIVDDPRQAFAHRESVMALGRLGTVLGAITIITGRPVTQVLELGRLQGIAGLEALTIYGQYGADRWSAAHQQTVELDRPIAVTQAAEQLPALLAAHEAATARLEDKRIAVAVHTRGLGADVQSRLESPLRALAAEYGLTVEPGRQVIELRASAVDKGQALRQSVVENSARTVVFAGDDLGDLPAFDAVDQLRTEGVRGVLVCSASDEQDALVRRADIVLNGPDGVAAWLTAWADTLGI